MSSTDLGAGGEGLGGGGGGGGSVVGGGGGGRGDAAGEGGVDPLRAFSRARRIRSISIASMYLGTC